MLGREVSANFVFLIFISWMTVESGVCQSINSGTPVLEEAIRREQLNGKAPLTYSFQLRPITLFPKDTLGTFPTIERFYVNPIIRDEKLSKIRFSLLPIASSTELNTNRPYGWGNKGMIPNVGFQTYLSTGIYFKFHILEVQFQPEYVYAQNKPFQGFSRDFPTSVLQSRFFYWNNGDNPERFGDGSYSRFWWGQSSINLVAGPVSFGVSTQNIWWGPGQFNALIFSDNAEGFPHLSLATNKPIKTFVGNFQTQIIVGRLENSGLEPSQDTFLNRTYFKPFDGDWRYLNGITISYNPSFLENLFLGFSRTFQQYNKYRGRNFGDYFPIFEVFQKKGLFEDGHSVGYDSKGQDQQVSVTFRYLVPKAQFELYGEFGRRDHAYDWRDFVLTPEHASAYLLGFGKLFSLPTKDTFVQIRAEMTRQAESVNRYIRYPGLIGNQTWHTHGLARGFVNYGKTLGTGIGVGSNVQTLEISKVSGLNKRGIQLERLANNQDFFSRAFGQNPEKRPWIDFSLGLLWDQQWGGLVLSGKIQYIRAFNYQWQSRETSTSDFPEGQKLGAVFSQVHLIYRIGK